MSGTGADGVPSWDAGRDRILNALPVPKRFTSISDRPVPVRARLVWESTGEQFVDTVATGWRRARGEVPMALVTVLDPRSPVRGVWVPASDVRRR